jgi:hypothetical protein
MITIHPQSASDHVEGVLVSFSYRDDIRQSEPTHTAVLEVLGRI